MFDDAIYPYSSTCAMPGCNTPASRLCYVTPVDYPLVTCRMAVDMCAFCGEAMEARQAARWGDVATCGAVNIAASDVVDLKCELRPHPAGTPHFSKGYHWATEDEWKAVDPSKYIGARK